MTKSSKSQLPHSLSVAEQKNFITDILADFASGPVDDLFDYLRHCGLPLRVLRSVHDIVPAFVALYRKKPSGYDVDRACEDFRWWPPIADRIAELDAERQDRGNRPKVPKDLPDDL